MAEIVGVEEAVALIHDGMTVMVGGFLGCGGPERIMDALVAAGTKDLTIIANDAVTPDRGLGRLVANHQVRKLVASHVGTNREVAAQMNDGTLDVELVPQGSLIERVRCGGAGLGGILTPTGLGTPVAEGKQIITSQGREYVLETPLRADVAVISGHRVDEAGNVWYRGTTRNFAEWMALAADTTLVQADHVVPRGAISPEDVVTPGVLIDYIVAPEA